MSFFGFDATLPRDRGGQQAGAGGFFDNRQDPFAGYANQPDDKEEILDFDETYDGLGDNLQEVGDDLNDDTFGDSGKVGKDFDFSGQTAQARGTLLEEEALHYARQPPSRSFQQPTYQQPVYQQPARPTKSGYESYKQPDYIPQLEANASIWGLPSKKAPEPAPKQQEQATAASRKIMSLEEVEAAMRKQTTPQPPPQEQHQPPPQAPPGPRQDVQPQPFQGMPQILQRPPPTGPMQQFQGQQPPTGPSAGGLPPIQILQRQQQHQQQQYHQPPQGPMAMGQPGQFGHGRAPSMPINPMAQHMANLTDQQRELFLAEEAKRAKRNQKIYELSKNNGVMTPQDKNFITRIQLQQLMAASGGTDDRDAQLAEDFYYQVYAQIRGAPRQDPNQPLSHFAQTYLFQTGGRFGGGNRRHPRGGDNHVQRMEQQVQRAVEAAKARPKTRQLTVEGSLGKIAFSNSKTPRPLLNFKRPEADPKLHGKGAKVTGAGSKAARRDIEECYSVLMQLEDHERRLPPNPTEESNPGAIQLHIEWRERHKELSDKLWDNLKVMEPIQENSPTLHPFISILSYPKGKKLIPRIFRHINDQQRTTLLTIIVLHLDVLDVVRLAYPQPDEPRPPPAVREAVELFVHAVLPPLFAFVNEAPLTIVSGLLGLIIDRVNIQTIIRTKIGVTILTILISRAEVLKQGGGPSTEDDWSQFNQLYGRLFDLAEPVLPYIFSVESVSSSDDVQVWQFLAAMGLSATPDQQQRLVLGVKDRVMETVGVAKTLPQDMGARKLGEVNLFMRAIGLDVELLG
ncbi:DNA topoisomerase 2-associated protein pat1 [Sphaceloma murrayae]|uniref:DNA topoisomerase 2-associated protein pat1 n=1 Tax=Sphaceloma murrayae TaxID=2082308 RepID=A0A2K1QUK5_9PEZI|nr:DNA topoisomerase 2-associated protein pat1 [Sphaceloma murrayae]